MPRLRAASRLPFESLPLSVIHPRRDVRTDAEQCLELAAVAGLSAGEVEVERQALEVRL